MSLSIDDVRTIGASVTATGLISTNMAVLVKLQPAIRLAMALRTFERTAAAGHDTRDLAAVIRAAVGGDVHPPAT